MGANIPGKAQALVFYLAGLPACTLQCSFGEADGYQNFDVARAQAVRIAAEQTQA